jgi:hypothetical protein
VIARLEGADLPVTGQDVAITVVGSALPFPAVPGAALPAAVALSAGAEVDAGSPDGAPALA